MAAAAAVVAGSQGVSRSAVSSNPAPNPDYNEPLKWPVDINYPAITLTVEASEYGQAVQRNIFGTNVEWFNNGDGFATSLNTQLTQLATDLGTTVIRFPGGVLSDYYHWKDGTGPLADRPVRPHYIDSGSSVNNFGSPELFKLLHATGAQALLTVNAGTGTAAEAAGWVAYCNAATNAQRAADGFTKPIGVKFWEVGNELYYPANPGTPSVSVTPQVYAARFLEYASAMRAVDPSITIMGIGVATGAHVGPDTPYQDWSQVLLEAAAPQMDMISVHPCYFPYLYNVVTPPLTTVYPALWAAPDAVETALNNLTTLIEKYEGKRTTPLGIAVTEWGALFSLPQLDPYSFDHVKTLGSAVYMARVLQVLLSNPRVMLATHFKFTDRTFQGMITGEGDPKLPSYLLQLMLQQLGTKLVTSSLAGVPTYSTPGIGTIAARDNVPDVTVLSTRNATTGRLYLNLVNRSVYRYHKINVNISGMTPSQSAALYMLSGPEPTMQDGRDIAPESPYSPAMEPYTTPRTTPGDIVLTVVKSNAQIVLPPFSVATYVVDEA
jgi:alpha-N-arabinofuranosidase